MESTKETFTETIRQVADAGDVQQIDRRQAVCSNLKENIRGDAPFKNWWLEDFAGDHDRMSITMLDVYQANDNVSCMNSLFSNKIREWTDIHVQIGTQNLEFTKQLEECLRNASIIYVSFKVTSPYFKVFVLISIVLLAGRGYIV